jgi:hypothetical protein
MLIVVNTPVNASAPAVPKNLCLDWTSFADFSQLLIKNQGTVKSVDGPIKMFSIFGHAFNGARMPIVGNGYVAPATTIFHATFTGNFRTGSSSVANWELFFDLVTQTGTIYYHYDSTSGSKISGSSGVVPTNCANLAVPAITVGDQKFSSDQ